MSYSDDRDELDELFGSGKKDKPGYSEELPLPKQGTRRPSEEATLPPRKQISGNAPVQSVEVEIPIKRKDTPPSPKEEMINDELESFVEQEVPDFREDIPADTSPADTSPADT